METTTPRPIPAPRHEASDLRPRRHLGLQHRRQLLVATTVTAFAALLIGTLLGYNLPQPGVSSVTVQEQTR